MRVSLLVLFVALGFLTTQARATSPLDSDRDGFPDSVELYSEGDRRAFLDWFASIAEAQYASPSPDWHYRDCSGLLRFAFIEALKPKNSDWFGQFRYFPLPHTEPLKVSHYPMPLISRSVFRIAPGAYQLDDVEKGRMVGLATAFELMAFSSVPLGRHESVAQRGDLLFFSHPLAEGSGYHSMVYLGDGRIVYHTGLSPDDGGEVRLLSLETLRKHPDSSWHPDASNPHFLGFYRWKIVD